jgi:hypothetical protein
MPQVRECVNDCSHNGWWTNGSCACEPIYAGADCSVNLMHKAAAQLLAGLQLRYTGPMALNKQVLASTIFHALDSLGWAHRYVGTVCVVRSKQRSRATAKGGMS